MRKAFLVIGLAALAGLSGCDVWDRIVEPPKPAVVTCQCAPALPATPAPAPAPRLARTVRHHAYRRYAANQYAGSSYRWHRRYAESGVDIYDYSSASSHYGHSHYGEDHGEHYGVRQDKEGDHFTGNTRVWADGYGRRHIYDQSAVAHYAYQARVRAEQGHSRRDPWHGYNDDWDE
ncbi:MAG: hypothetical protein KGJ75_14380 [Alphaproteobacteria bacterium]|nr:hypothetical protein [Alphaproteobacteria bacterium]